VSMNQSMNQIDAKVRWYSAMECSQALIGFLVATALVVWVGPTAINLLAGLTVGSLVCVVADGKATLRGFGSAAFDRATARDIIRQAMPLTVVFLMGALLLYSDRFVLETLSTSEQLGLYAAAAALAERPLSTLCITVTAGLYALAARSLGFEGEQAGRTQMAANVLALISVGLPASVGLALLSQPIANALVGPEFRAGAAALLPVFAVVAMLRSLNVHCFDHAFYLARQGRLLLGVYAPVVTANILLSVASVPFIGVYGTLFSALVSQILLVWMELRAIQRVFPLPFRYGELGKIVLATAGMALVVLAVRAPGGWERLLVDILIGGATYAALFVALDILDVRAEAAPLLRRLMPPRWRVRGSA
jgi:O-antigen/teichoic acid export membrane protein